MRSNKWIVLAAIVVVLGFGLGASDDNVRIGVFDLDQAVLSTDEGRAAREEFDRKKREAESVLKPLLEQYQEKLKELEAKKFVLSDDALFQKQLDLAELRNQIGNRQKEVQGQLEVDRERLLAPLRNKLVGIVEQVGKEQGFSLILLRNAPGVMYSREALDVTDMIIAKFNAKG